MKKVISFIFGTMLILFGVGLYLYPTVSTWWLNRQTDDYIKDFNQTYDIVTEKVTETITEEAEETETTSTEDTTVFRDKEGDSLYESIVEYNESIYENGQKDFVDAWSYVDSPISLDGLEDDKFGYIEIPAMNVTLPLYVGASISKMAKGATVLGQTSLPIGGTNTNSVIAGHRGYKGSPFFREIEKLSIGDYVYITNPWERLIYQVESIDIINPYDSEKLVIQEGKDMITLLTCHPYMSHGKYRYLVYCVRVDDDGSGEKGTETAVESSNTSETTEKTTYSSYIVASDGTVYESSESVIQYENMVRQGAAIAIVAMIVITFIVVQVKKRR
jgi:sortase A